MLNDFAVFDTMAVLKHLRESLGGVTKPEVHLFSYLACLLSLYRGQPVADWEYQFVGTRQGTPFSDEIEQAFKSLNSSGFVIDDGTSILLSDTGQESYLKFEQLSRYRSRSTYLEGACSSVLSLPPGLIREALQQEPGLKHASATVSAKRLLEGAGLDGLHDQFQQLSAAIGVNIEELMIPATIWLTVLTKAAQEEVTKQLGEPRSNVE